MGTESNSWRRRMFQAILGTSILVAALGLYLIVLRWRGAAAVFNTQTACDRLIPFQAEWLYVYLAPYPLAPLILGIMKPPTFQWFMKRALLIVFISLAIFAICPTQTVRPTDNLGNGRTAQFYRNIVAIDEPPANAAPSLHVSLTCLLAIALLRDFHRLWTTIIAGVALVWLATLFTWQHHLIDVATGGLLGLLVGLVRSRPS